MMNLEFYATPTPAPQRRRTARLRATVLFLCMGLTTPALAESDVHVLAAQPNRTALEAAPTVGADPEQRDPIGNLSLMAAVKTQRTDSVKSLLAAGADPDDTNRLGESSLHLAAVSDPNILKSLLDAGANANLRDAGGVTPVMVAVAAGREDNIKLLRGSGARLDMKDYQGSSVKDWAVRGGHAALAARLESELVSSVTATVEKTTGLNFAEDVFVDVKFPEWFKTATIPLIGFAKCSTIWRRGATCISRSAIICRRQRKQARRSQSSRTIYSRPLPTCSTAGQYRHNGRCSFCSNGRDALLVSGSMNAY